MQLLEKPAGLLATLLVGGGFLLSACTSEMSSDAAADSTTVSPTTSVAKAPRSGTSEEPAATPGGRSLTEKLTDASVRARAKRSLFRDSRLRVFSFRLTVRNGHLTLRGDVNTPGQYRRAERIVEHVEGVRALTNRLTMGGRPVTQDRLAESDSAKASHGEATVYHTVRRGDTLWRIARQYRSSVEQLRRLNDFRSDELSPGQRIRVR